MKVPSQERLKSILKRARSLDISDEKDRAKAFRALKRVVEEKERDPEDMDPFLRNFLEDKEPEMWLERIMFFAAIEGERGEVVGGIYGRAYDENKEPYIAHYVPFKAGYLKELCGAIGFLCKKVSVPVEHEQYYELVAFTLGDEVEGKRLRHEDLFFAIGGFDSTLILKNFPSNARLCLGSVPVVTSKKDKLQQVVAKRFLLELLTEDFAKERRRVLTVDDFGNERAQGWIEGAYAALNGSNSLDYGKLVSELSKLTSIDWDFLVRYSNFIDRRIAPVDTWSEEGNWTIWGTSLPWLVNHLARKLWELNVVSSIGGALLADR